MDNDRVFVFDKGQVCTNRLCDTHVFEVIEVGAPETLLADEHSVFHSMATPQ